MFYGDDEDRKDLIVAKILSAAKKYLPVLVAIEGWSMASKGGKAFTRYELFGAVKHELNMLEIPWIVYAPMSLKKFATGNGHAEKDDMINTAIGFGYRNLPDGADDLADAFHLARYAAYFITLLDPEQRFASV